MVKGAEVMGYSPLLSGQEIAEDCSKEKDAIFYKNINNEQEVVVSEKCIQFSILPTFTDHPVW